MTKGDGFCKGKEESKERREREREREREYLYLYLYLSIVTYSNALKVFRFRVFLNTLRADRNTLEGQVQAPASPAFIFNWRKKNPKVWLLAQASLLREFLQTYILHYFLYPYILISYIPIFLILYSF